MPATATKPRTAKADPPVETASAALARDEQERAAERAEQITKYVCALKLADSAKIVEVARALGRSASEVAADELLAEQHRAALAAADSLGPQIATLRDELTALRAKEKAMAAERERLTVEIGRCVVGLPMRIGALTTQQNQHRAAALKALAEIRRAIENCDHSETHIAKGLVR